MSCESVRQIEGSSRTLAATAALSPITVLQASLSSDSVPSTSPQDKDTPMPPRSKRVANKLSKGFLGVLRRLLCHVARCYIRNSADSEETVQAPKQAPHEAAQSSSCAKLEA